MSDLVGKYRRQVLLDLFGEDASSLASTRESCCDICSQSKEVSVSDRVKELDSVQLRTGSFLFTRAVVAP